MEADKNKKAATDTRRSQIFAKLAKAITTAARDKPNPDFNPRLRAAIIRARADNMPSENIGRAIKKSKEGVVMETLAIEAYGPGGIAILAEVVTDNRNKAVAENKPPRSKLTRNSQVKHILAEYGGKLAEPGTVKWAIEKNHRGWWNGVESKIPAGNNTRKRETLIWTDKSLGRAW